MKSAKKPMTVQEYLAGLPDDRRAAVSAIRKAILDNLDSDYEEGIQYGMIGYYVPHRVHPAGYHCDPRQPLPFVMLASQKGYIAIHMMPIYTASAAPAGSAEAKYADWFRAAWAASGKKLDMGKACIRIKSIEHVPLEVVGEAIRRLPTKKWIDIFQRMSGNGKSAKSSKAAKPRTKAVKSTVKAVKRSSSKAV